MLANQSINQSVLVAPELPRRTPRRELPGKQEDVRVRLVTHMSRFESQNSESAHVHHKLRFDKLFLLYEVLGLSHVAVGRGPVRGV